MNIINSKRLERLKKSLETHIFLAEDEDEFIEEFNDLVSCVCCSSLDKIEEFFDDADAQIDELFTKYFIFNFEDYYEYEYEYDCDIEFNYEEKEEEEEHEIL